MSSLRFDCRLPPRPGGGTPLDTRLGGHDGHRDERHDDESHRRFEALLHDRRGQETAAPPPLPFSLASLVPPADGNPEATAREGGEPGTSRPASGTVTPEMSMPLAMPALPAGKPLHLRLTNGPCAGMEIQAAMRGATLSLRVTLADRRRFERFAGQRERLASVLEAIFECPICLEVEHETAPPR